MTSPDSSPIRTISDTACWSALYRARESERADALFRDPLARRLAGSRGEQIAATVPFSDRNTWSWVARTWLFDQFIRRCIGGGADTVVNLAAGLDTRPYRMSLPPNLRWFEIDLPDILDYKEDVLEGERPVCSLERIRLNLTDTDSRRETFERISASASNAVIVAEGFLIYLDSAQVASLARDLVAERTLRNWIVDLASPGLLKLLQKNMSAQLTTGGAPFQFAPPEGPGFFTAQGWCPEDVRSLLKTARGLQRLSWPMWLLSLLPASNGRQGSRPWGGVCLLERSDVTEDKPKNH
jgi:methyltransferase (TIGR00027 family)